MTTLDNVFSAKICSKFYCKFCEYRTCKKSSYTSHSNSKKHKNNALTTLDNDFEAKLCQKKYSCENCDKDFNDRAGLWRHKKKCVNVKESSFQTQTQNIDASNNIIFELIKQNQEFKELIIEQNNKIIELANKVGSTTNTNCNNTNTNNNHFNLQIFLNETCKDALNLTEFVEQIKLQLSDLDMIGRIGYTEGMSKILIKNLKELDVHKRPIHCSDLKRETIYVKDKDGWEKENYENIKLKRVIKQVENKNIKQIPKWKAENPTAEDTETKKHMEYQNILLEAMGGSTQEDDNKKHEKIIKNIAKEVTIDKKTP